MPLEHSKRKALLGVMTSMFTTLEDLRTFLKNSLGRNMDALAVGKLGTVISGVIDRADEREWLRELIEALKEEGGDDAKAQLDAIDVTGHFSNAKVHALRAAVPDLRERAGLTDEAALDAALATRLIEVAQTVRGQGTVTPQLRRALEQLGLVAETPAGPSLEKIVNDSNSLLDIHTWLTRLTEIEGQVCRIGFQTASGLVPKGTGFLVAPDVVLTNRHVLAAVYAKDYTPEQIRVQFDYHVLRDGSVDAGTIVKLRDGDGWLIASQRHDPIDTKEHDLAEEPQPDCLDYALLRLAQKVGSAPIAANGTKERGWIDLTVTAPKAAPGSPVFIVQHPSGAPMKLALDTNGVIGYSPNALRIRYRTNTLGGSSGSPVFNQNWELLALHHAGDPKYPELDTGKYNEGIPIRTLVQHLTDKKILETL
jgi:hypothetical protein